MNDEKGGLWYRCREFVEKQSAGEWDDKTIADDADRLMEFVRHEIKRTLPRQEGQSVIPEQRDAT